MSEDSIIKEIEGYISRPLDDEDRRDLRRLLEKFQKPKVKTVVKPSEVKPKEIVRNDDSEQKPVLSLKDRLGNWEEKAKDDSPPVSDPNLNNELAEIKAIGVKDRLGSWQEKATDEPTNKIQKEEVKVGTGLKNRMNAFQEKASEGPKKPEPEVVEPQGSLKDRMKAYTSVAEKEPILATKDSSKAHEIQAETKSLGLKERMNQYSKVAEKEAVLSAQDPSKVAEIENETKAAGLGLKDRLNQYSKVAEKEVVLGSKDPSKVAEIHSEVKSGPALKDRMNMLNEATKQEEYKRKDPIKIDFGY